MAATEDKTNELVCIIIGGEDFVLAQIRGHDYAIYFTSQALKKGFRLRDSFIHYTPSKDTISTALYISSVEEFCHLFSNREWLLPIQLLLPCLDSRDTSVFKSNETAELEFSYLEQLFNLVQTFIMQARKSRAISYQKDTTTINNPLTSNFIQEEF